MKKKHFWRNIFVVGIVYALIFIIYTFPFINHFSDAVIGQNDVNQYIWNTYIFKQNFESGQNLFHTDNILYPEGVDLYLHTYTPVMGFLGLFFDNIILSNNIYIFLNFIFSAIGAYLLSKKYFQNLLIPFIIGFIFAYSPYKMVRLLEHHNLVLTGTIPFYIISFMNIFDFNKKINFLKISYKYVFISFIIGLLTLASDYYATFFLLYFSIFYLFFFVSKYLTINWKIWLKLGVIILIIVLGDQLTQWLMHWKFEQNGAITWWNGDIGLYILPIQNNRFLTNHFFNNIYLNHTNYKAAHENVLFVGFSFALMSLTALTLYVKTVKNDTIRVFTFLSFVFFLLTIPKIQFFSNRIIYSPLSFLHFIPFINKIRCPTRFELMLLLFLPIVVFYIWDQKILSKFAKKYQNGFLVLTFLVLFFEYYPKEYPLLKYNEIPKVYSALEKKDGDVLLPIRFGVLSGYHSEGHFQKNDLFYQLKHNKKLVSGYISHISRERFKEYTSDSTFKQIILLEDRPWLKNNKVFGKKIMESFLAKYKIDFITIEPKARPLAVTDFILSNFKPYIKQKQEIDGYLLITLNNPFKNGQSNSK